MTAIIALINHVIRQNREIHAALVPFAGKTLSLRAAGMHICGTFGSNGFLQAAAADADTEITFRDSALQKVLQGKTPGVGDVSIAGDTELGMLLLPLLGGLRYHAGDDLSRLFGEAAAGSIGTRAAEAGRAAKNIGLSIIEQLGDFAREPESPVINRETFEQWAQQVEVLRDDAARLEARLANVQNRVSER